MAGVYQTFHTSREHDHGLRFVNEEWNDSIANGDKFLLKWNASVVGAAAQLGLFKVTYPKDGVVVYELAANLTGMLLQPSEPHRSLDFSLFGGRGLIVTMVSLMHFVGTAYD